MLRASVRCLPRFSARRHVRPQRLPPSRAASMKSETDAQRTQQSVSPRAASARASSVLETLLEIPAIDKAPSHSSSAYLTPSRPPPRKPDEAWVKEEAELIKLFDLLKSETLQERALEVERMRIREAMQKSSSLESTTPLKWHLSRIGPSTSHVANVEAQQAQTRTPAATSGGALPSATPHYTPLASSVPLSIPLLEQRPPPAWDTEESEESTTITAAKTYPLPRTRNFFSLLRADVANLFYYTTSAKLRKLLAIESTHLAWIRFLLALLALLLLVPEDSSVAPSPESQRVLRLLLLALLLLHTQQLLVRLSELQLTRRPMSVSSTVSAASFALVWILAVFLLPSSTPSPDSLTIPSHITPVVAAPTPTPTPTPTSS